MQVVTIPKTEYEILEKRAKLYSRLLAKEERRFPVESYSEERVKEFLAEDKVGDAIKSKARKILRAR